VIATLASLRTRQIARTGGAVMWSGRKGSAAMLRDLIVDWKTWSRTERRIVIAAAFLIIALLGIDVAAS